MLLTQTKAQPAIIVNLDLKTKNKNCIKMPFCVTAIRSLQDDFWRKTDTDWNLIIEGFIDEPFKLHLNKKLNRFCTNTVCKL